MRGDHLGVVSGFFTERTGLLWVPSTRARPERIERRLRPLPHRLPSATHTAIVADYARTSFRSERRGVCLVDTDPAACALEPRVATGGGRLSY
jgi:hypothetical protein